MSTLYVGNLPFDTKDEDLKTAFDKYECTSAEMQRRHDGRSKGFALVVVGKADDAIAGLHDTEFQGRKMIVRADKGPTVRERRPKQRPPADADIQPSPTIYVGNLPFDVDSDKLATLFPGAKTAVVQMGRDKRSRGYGLVTYDGVEGAQKAIAEKHDMDVGGRKIRCRYSYRE